MALTHHFDEPVAAPSGMYLARVYAGTIEGGRWGGWVVFFPVGGGRVISTERETTQPSLAALSTWAGRLTRAFLEVALQRALELNPGAELERELRRLEQADRDRAAAEMRAEDLEAAASGARGEAELLALKQEYAEERVLATAAGLTTQAQIHRDRDGVPRRTAHAADTALGARRKNRS